MSLADLTRNSYQNGISATQWLGLCKLWVEKEKERSRQGSLDVGPAISGVTEADLRNICWNQTDAVISLCNVYVADLTLQSYLRHALSDGLVSTSDIVGAFLHAASSSQLQDASTLDMLCRVALDAHYASGLPPLGSLTAVLATVHEALDFLRQAYSLSSSSFHRVTTSASELVALLLSCVTDFSQISTAQAMIYFGDTNDLLHSVLETFALSLSLLIGDDAKAAREAQMIHSMQLALGRSDMLGSNPEADSIICGLLLQSLISSRASDYGAGSGSEAVALLIGVLRWTSWAPNVFYTQILLASMTCVAQSAPKGIHDGSFFIWRNFVLGRLPRLLYAFEKGMEGHGTLEADWRAAMHTAVSTVLQRTDLLSQCDNVQARGRSIESSQEDNTSQRSFVRDLMQHLHMTGLIDQAFATTIDPTIINDAGTRLQAEAFEHNSTLEHYLESKLTMESSEEDTQALLKRISQEPGTHHFFAEVVRKHFTSHSKSGDVEVLSHLTKILYAHDFALDILSLHLKITDLVFEALELLCEYDCETVGDPQAAVSHLGDIVLFAQMISAPSLKKGTKVFRTDLLRSSRVYHPDELPSEMKIVFTGWFKAIFDSSSEGIDDTILRSTKPKTLLQMSATLFSQACIARQEGRIDNDVLHNGISYFLGPLLNWTLVGVVHAMLFEVQQRGLAAPFQLEVLQSLLLAPTCPHVVQRLCSPNILKILSGRRTQRVVSSLHYDIGAIRSLAFRTLSIKQESEGNAQTQTQDETSTTSPGAFLDFPTREIRDALALARQQKAPRIDIGRCLTSRELETCRRLSTFVLVTPRAGVPPLLPLFVYNVLPLLIAAVDQQQGGDTNVCNEHNSVLGQPSAVLARKLAADLRARRATSTTSGTMLQRLAASPPFVANFPAFML
ncbi:hypothetical protein BU15DRAFT_86664 [Melanogaster broomeanus]|nr:hypothetical protein BU15DRAFT_86664 [Melanogaster broomeanus]